MFRLNSIKLGCSERVDVNAATDSIDDSQKSDLSLRVTGVDAFRGALVLLAFLLMFAVPAMREWGSGWLVDLFYPSVWHGVKLVDFIEPGFLFVMGISASLSVSHRLKRGESRSRILDHLVKRCVGLCVLGLLLENWISFDWPEVRWTGTYQRLAICNLGVGILCCFTDRAFRLGFACFCLLNYGFAFEAIGLPPPPPVLGARVQVVAVDPYSMEYNLAAYVDRILLPGRKFYETWDQFGLLTILPAFLIALLGSCSQQIFIEDSGTRTGWMKRLLLIVSSSVLGFLIGLIQPLNSILMTPGFILLVFSLSGFCLLIFSRFSQSMDRNDLLCLLQLIGRQALPLMLVAHLVASASTAIVSQTTDSVWFAIPALQTLIAIWAVAGLCLICSWMNRNDISIRL